MSAAELPALAASARLLGFLLQCELSPGVVRTLAGVREALAELGMMLPEPTDEAALEELAAAYFAAFVDPERGPPPVQSVVSGGGYEGPPAAAIRALATQLGLDRDTAAARGAPPDHLGSELELWAEIAERMPAQAPAFAAAHLAWARPWLRRAAGEGFYGRLCAATLGLVEAVCGDPAAQNA